MISKKTKALAAAMLSAAMTATAVVPAVSSAAAPKATSEALKSDESYISMFESLYDDVMTNGVSNGFMSKQNNGAKKFGIPYHAVETLVVEAPDYGHETTSEAMSYIVWMAAMHDALVKQKVISGSSDLEKAWNTLEAIIPGWSEASGRNKDVLYETFWTQQKIQSDVGPEMDSPEMDSP